MGNPARSSQERCLPPLVFLASFVFFYCSAYPLLSDADVPWHLAAGELIWRMHHLPATDPWAFGSQGAPWYNLSWLWDMIVGGLDMVLGPFSVVLMVDALAASLLALVAFMLTRRGIAVRAIIPTVLVAALCLPDFITARPQMAGYALALVFQLTLHGSRDSGRYGKLAALPPLMALWANLHGSFIAGFTVLGAYMAEAFFTRQDGWLRRLAVITATCAVGIMLNPYGPHIFTGVMRTLGGSARQFTVEWMPYIFSLNAGVSAWLLVFILASDLRIKNVPPADKLLALAWLVATMFVIRNGAFFILLSAPYVAACVERQAGDYYAPPPPSAFIAAIMRQPLPRLWGASLALAALLAGGAYVLPHEKKIGSPDVSDAVGFALAHYPTHRYLNDINEGGQILYLTGGRLHYFIDSRDATAFSERTMEEYLDFMQLKPGWQETMRSHGINGIIASNASEFAQAYDDGMYRKNWERVFTGNAASVYIARP